MKTIYKYPLTEIDRQTISLPKYNKILKVDEQHGDLYLWALVDTDNEEEEITIEFNGTGYPVAELERGTLRQHLNTIITSYGLVWHVFRIVKISTDR